MNKIFAFCLAVIIVASAAVISVGASDAPLEFYAGIKEGAEAPKADGEITKDEYAVAIENLNPNDPNGEYYKYLVYSDLVGGDKTASGKSNTISFSIYMSIDDEYLYLASVEEDYPDSTWQGQPHEDNKAVTFIDFTLPSSTSFRCRLVSSSGEFDGFCQDVEENKIVPEESDRALTNVLKDGKRYITVEMRIKIADIEEMLGEKLPNTIYFVAFSRFDGDELTSYDDVVFQALHEDAVLCEMASWIGCTLLRKSHTLHLNEEGKCAHRGMSGKAIDKSTHKLTCDCGYTEESEHIWNEGQITQEATPESNGEMVYSCNMCNAKLKKAVPYEGEDTPDESTDDNSENVSDNITDSTSGEDNGKNTGCGASVSAFGTMLLATLALGAVSFKKKK